MIIKYFDSGTSKAESATNYLLQKTDAEGKLREPPPEILSGSLELVKNLINENPRKNKYTSLVFAFAKGENPTDERLKEILKAYKETMAPDMGDRVQFLAVKHTHEGNTELHIVTPKFDMKSGKAFNIAPPGQKTKTLNEDFTKLINDRYGWDQVIENPFKLALKSFDSKVPKQKHYKERTAKVSTVVKDLVMNGRINNREDLCKFFEDVGLKVEGKYKDSLKIKFKDGTSRRFKGKIFREDSNYSLIIGQHKSQSKQLSEKKKTECHSRLLETVKERSLFNKDRYLKPSKKRVIKSANSKANISKSTNQEYQFNLKCDRAFKALDKIHSESKEPPKSLEGKLNSLCSGLKERIENSEKSTPKQSSKSADNKSLASVEVSIQEAIAELSNAKTMEERFRAYFKLAELMERRRKLALELLEGSNKENTAQATHPRPRPR